MRTIAIGSTNTQKRRAVNFGLKRLGFIEQHELIMSGVSSYMPAGPDGRSEVRQGAINRARGVHELFPHAWSFGLEGGTDSVVYDQAEHGLGICAVAIVAPNGRNIVLDGLPLPVPIKMVQEFRRRDRRTFSFGDYVAETMGGRPWDAVQMISGGAAMRYDTYVPAIELGLRLLRF